MDVNIKPTLDSFEEGTIEVAETAQEKTNEFHENYVSKVVPDCGKYGEVATFAVEMVPGVAEYNDIREGDWESFAIDAGIDTAAIVLGGVSAGAGYAAVKGGSVAAKTGGKAAAKVVAKEVGKEGAKQVAKEVAEVGTKEVAKEIAETATKQAAKEVAEKTTEKVVKEVAEEGVEKVTKEIAETEVKNVVSETAKDTVETSVKKVAEETTDKVTETAVKEVDETAQIVINKMDGIAREEDVLEKLTSEYGEKNVWREQIIRDELGNPIIDPVTGTYRRLDFVITEGDQVVRSIEVTSETAIKDAQTAKELRILEKAKKLGGAYMRDSNTGDLYKFTNDLSTEIVRLP